MHCNTRTLLLLPVFAVAFTSGASAQAARRPSTVAALQPAAVDSTSLRERLARADELVRDGRDGEAAKFLRRVVRERREAGASAADPLYRLAAIYFTHRNFSGAAATLDAAAADAETHGEPVLQARALIESASSYAKLGDGERMADRVARLRPLLSSPHIPQDEREDMLARLR
jgi:thioredoxin-like negative regulator of GroEL